MDWLDLLAVQGTLKSLLQHHSSKASVLWRSAFFTVQLSHPYVTTGKTIALTWQTFVGKVMSLLCNMLSRLVITFLPRSKCLFISWLQSPTSTSALLTMTKPLTVCITINYGKLLKRWEYQTTWPASWEICRQVKRQQLELNMEKWTGSKMGKKYVKAEYCHPAYLTYTQNTSCEVPGGWSSSLNQDDWKVIHITSDMKMTLPLWKTTKRN